MKDYIKYLNTQAVKCDMLLALGHLEKMNGVTQAFLDEFKKHIDTAIEPEMRAVAQLITRVLENVGKPEVVAEVRRGVAALTAQFPLYAWKLAAAAR
mgnify:CR=1 FL=1